MLFMMTGKGWFSPSALQWAPTLTYRDSNPPLPLLPEGDVLAAGPLLPASTVAVTAPRVFPVVFVGDGANGHRSDWLGVEASLGADAEYHLEFLMPPGSLPSGTAKLRLLALADAVAGDAKVNVKWVSVAVGEDPSSATLQAEGTSTLTWSTNDDDEYQELKVTLDADTLVAGEICVIHLTFETSGWTLATVSAWLPGIIWE